MGFGGKVLTGSVLALIGLYTVKFVVALVTGLLGLVWFLLTVVLPIALGIWLVMKLVRRNRSKPAFE